MSSLSWSAWPPLLYPPPPPGPENFLVSKAARLLHDLSGQGTNISIGAFNNEKILCSKGLLWEL